MFVTTTMTNWRIFLTNGERPFYVDVTAINEKLAVEKATKRAIELGYSNLSLVQAWDCGAVSEETA